MVGRRHARPDRRRRLDPRNDLVLARHLGVQLKLVVGVAPVTAPLVGARVPAAAADGLDTHGGAATAVVGVAGVGVADGAVDLEEAADEGLEERGAGGDDADVELEAVRGKACECLSGERCDTIPLATYFCQTWTQ